MSHKADLKCGQVNKEGSRFRALMAAQLNAASVDTSFAAVSEAVLEPDISPSAGTASDERAS